jgi:hypothetical protein
MSTALQTMQTTQTTPPKGTGQTTELSIQLYALAEHWGILHHAARAALPVPTNPTLEWAQRETEELRKWLDTAEELFTEHEVRSAAFQSVVPGLIDGARDAVERGDADTAERMVSMAEELLDALAHAARARREAWDAARRWQSALNSAVADMRHEELDSRREALNQWLADAQEAMQQEEELGAIHDFIRASFGTRAAEGWLNFVQGAGKATRAIAITAGALIGGAVLLPIGWWAFRRIFR